VTGVQTCALPISTAFANGKFVGPGGTMFGGNPSQRGDMQALIAAVLLDPEARRGDVASSTNNLDGHLREPVLLTTSILRSFNATTNSNNTLVYVALNMGGEFLFYSDTVFNFYSPLYQVPSILTPQAAQPLSGPEFQIYTSASSLSRVDWVKNIFFGLDPSTTFSRSPYAALASNDPGAMIDALNAQLLHSTMSDAMRTQVLNAVNAVSSSDPVNRTNTAAYLIASSPQYQVQR